MYQFSEKWDSDIFFMFDKKLVEDKNWALLPPAAKAVFPVIACHQNKECIAFPGEQAISALSGRSEKTVRNGIVALEGFPSFAITITSYITKRGRRSKKFKIDKPPKVKGRSFPFHKSILESGLWSQLTPSAQALYIAIRKFAFFDFEVVVKPQCSYGRDWLNGKNYRS
ncbi:hypothetical protein KAI46_15260 [bacterium]|nr:hypothetical protein [bacterium]